MGMIINPYRFVVSGINQIVSSRDLRNGAAWSTDAQTQTYDQTGLDDDPNTATYLADTSGSFRTAAQNITISADSETHTAVFYYKKTTGATVFPGALLDLSGGTLVRSAWTVGTNTGILTARGSNAGTVDKLIESYGDWWRVSAEATNNGTNNNILIWVVPAATSSESSGSWQGTHQGDVIVGNVEVYFNSTIEDVSGYAPNYT